MASRRAHAYDDSWPLRLDFRFEPWFARQYFPDRRLLVETAFTAPNPFEMLDRVRYINPFSRYTGFDERFVEHASRRSNKRMALAVFLITRLLADQEQVDFWRALAENRLNGVLV